MQDITPQQQYLANWHNNFVKYVQWLWTYMGTFENHPLATEMDKCGLDAIKLVLSGNDVIEIERNLTEGSTTGALKKDTLEKIEKLNKDIVDIAIEHSSDNPLWNVFLKQLFHQHIERGKEAERMRLDELKITLLKTNRFIGPF